MLSEERELRVYEHEVSWGVGEKSRRIICICFHALNYRPLDGMWEQGMF